MGKVIKTKLVPKGICLNFFGLFLTQDKSWIDKYVVNHELIHTAQQKESELWRKSTEENFKNTYNTLKSEYYGFKSQMDDAERVGKLYEKQTTLAQTTYNLIVKEFITGKSDLTNVIQVQRQLLDYQLRKAEALANYNTMVVSIKKLLAENNYELSKNLSNE